MSQSLDPDQFFQTSASLEQRERRAAKAKSNKKGRPILLSSKPLALLTDPQHGHLIYVAMSAGEVRRVDIETQAVSPPFRPRAAASDPAIPLTSLALLPTPSNSTSVAGTVTKNGPNSGVLFAGSWSTYIYAWDTASHDLLYVLQNGHGDFVKALTLLSLPVAENAPEHGQVSTRKTLLASAGADARIAIWDVSPSPQPRSRQVAMLTGHKRAVLALAADPETEDREAVLFSASSDAEVKRWGIQNEGDVGTARGLGIEEGSRNAAMKAYETPFAEPLRPHHTSISVLAFASSGDLWTASADGCAQCLARPDADLSRGAREGGGSRTPAQPAWRTDTTLQHGATNVVRALAVSRDGRYVVTGCRDEDVWVWDAASGELVGKFVGHADEITAVAMLDGSRWGMGDKASDSKGNGARSWVVASAALDGRLCSWTWSDLVKGGDGDGGRGTDGGPGRRPSENKNVREQKTSEEPERLQLTMEEEAELAALMEDD